MKKLHLTRRQILRTIHAATIALLFVLAASRAHAQTYTAPFTISGTTVSATTAGTYDSPVGFYDSVNTYSSISVGSGVTINSTAPYGGTIDDIYADVNATTSSFTNQGTLSLNTNSGPYQAAVNLTQGATSVNVGNSGTLSVVGGSSINSGFALRVLSTSGNITVNNSGTMSTSGGTLDYAVDLHSTSGSLSFTNTQTGTVTLNGSGYPFLALTGGSGNVSFINDGLISSTDRGIVLEADAGTTQAVNTGTISLTGTGDILYIGAAGPITVTNSGALTGTNSDYGIGVAGGSSVTVTNSKTISGVQYGIWSFGTGTMTLSNTGTITSTNSGIYAGAGGTASTFNIRNTGVINSGSFGIHVLTSPATVYDSGSIHATTAISLPSGSALTLAGQQPTITGTISGGATSASTSTLAFDLTLPAAQLAAAKKQLNAEIAAYTAQHGGDLTFTVDSLTFDISNFAYGAGDISDGLNSVLAHLYANVPGFRSMGTVLDNLNASNPQAGHILGGLNNVSEAGLQGALSELSPKSLEVFRNVAFDNNTFNSTEINDHLANLRDGLTGFDSSALSISEPSMDPTLSQVKDHLLAYSPSIHPGLVSDAIDPVLGAVDPKDMKSAQVNTVPVDRWSTFIAGNVILADLGNNFPYQDANYTTGAVTAGADYRLDEHFTVGALVSYAHTGIDLDNRGSKATVDSYTPGVYASYVDGGWYANGLASYVRNAYTDDRKIDITGLTGDNHGGTSGNQGTGDLTGGYEFQRGALKFGPVASLEYVHLAIQPMQEQGTTALDINNQSQDSLRSLLGFEGRYAAVIGGPGGQWVLTPHFSASWQHEYLDNSDGIVAQFDSAGGGSFSVETDSPDRDSAFLDAGLDATVDKNITVFVDYSTQVGQDDFFAQSAQGGVRIGF
jgi:uncharacterized protein with beta-barrel porin domain